MSKPLNEEYAALDGKHYWNCWGGRYHPERDGYCIHVFCEEDKTPNTLCGFKNATEGGGLSVPNQLDTPSCLRCRRIMQKRAALISRAADTKPKGE